MNRSFTLACWLLAGCFTDGDGDPFGACTVVGCGETAELRLPYAADEADLIGGTARVCHNDQCVDVLLDRVPMVEGGVGNAFAAGDLNGYVRIFRVDNELSVRASISQFTLALAPGDIYSLTYRAQDGRVLLDGRWIAREYVTSYPNGRACGPTCSAAQLEELPTSADLSGT